MNTKKILALLLALVMLVGVLAACGKKEYEDPERVASFSEIMKTTYTAEKDAPMSSLASLPSLDGFDYEADSQIGYYPDSILALVLLKKTDPLTNLDSYRVVSLYTGTVVASFDASTTSSADSSINISYSVSLNGPTYYVTKITSTYSVTTGYSYSCLYSLYDATGKAVFEDRAYGMNDSIESMDDMMYVIDGNIYDFNDETGALTFKCAYPVGYSVNLLSAYHKNGTYVYTSDGSNNYPVVLNNKFEIIATWMPPKNATGVRWFPLDDGNVFIQYSIQLPEDSGKYDYYDDANAKYDLVTEIFNVTDKTSEEVDFEYYLMSGFGYSLIMQIDKTKDMFVDGFENIVNVYPIFEKQISSNNADIEFFLMDNAGELGNSLKLVEGQTGLPDLIANGKFLVGTTYGCAIVNDEGEIIKQLTSASIDSAYVRYEIGDYTVIGNGIYNAAFELVYDFTAKNAIVETKIGSTLFIKEYTGESYKIIGFKADGTTFDTGVAYDATNIDAVCNNKSFNSIASLGVYCVSEYSDSTLTRTYKYYNCEGTELLSSDKRIGFQDFYSGENATLAYTTTSDANGPIYAWYIAKK